MVIAARARLLSPSEADSIEPLAREIIRSIPAAPPPLDDCDPLTHWFGDTSAALIRATEETIRERLIGAMTITASGTHLERVSGLASTFYVALFTVCRLLATRFRSSNPTWLRQPKRGEGRIGISSEALKKRLLNTLQNMAVTLASSSSLTSVKQPHPDIRLADSTKMSVCPKSIDFVLTSPPYCTRIDYTAATRIELAILEPLTHSSVDELGRQMLGSTRVPVHPIEVSESWGQCCLSFLENLRKHPAKASSGYYYRTHVDYFHKIAMSIDNIAAALKSQAAAVLVVQDSHYKEIHNDLPTMVGEIAEARGLSLTRRKDFRLSRSMSGINPHTRIYKRSPGALEAVLCLQKS